MQAKMSEFLRSQKGLLKELVAQLAKKYPYVSVLGTDSKGKEYQIKRSGININDSMWGERGFVLRVYNGQNYGELSFNQLTGEDIDVIIEEVDALLEDGPVALQGVVDIENYPLLEEEELSKSFYGEVEILPEEVGTSSKLARLTKIQEKALALSELLVDFQIRYEEVQISKVFISNKKDLEQSYFWSQAATLALVRRENNTKYYYQGFSGLKGVEILDELEDAYQEVVNTALELLDAGRVKPGEYEVICSPDVAGVIAHEAFGHGVEMDMFVKNRAKAVDYLNKKVASELVTMHDGAQAAQEVSSYLFDDEGTLGSDTVIIDQGILKTGISDQLSALKLGTRASGNGKRESFMRKAYARMTNTFFAPGKDKLEDMIASIEDGYLLDGVMSGMEDPKNWGIQCMLILGREIKNGQLTGKLVSPVVLTGYVPEVLKSISMVSDDFKLTGTGYCGKGYKEFVKTSSGGPYIKAKVRLG